MGTPITGTNVAAEIVPFTTSDNYPTHDSQFGLGGWHEVTTLANLNAIPSARLRAGMAGYVTSDGTPANNGMYVWDGSAWNPFGGGGSGPTISVNGTPTSTQSVLNFQNGTGISISNPSGGNVQIASTIAFEVGGTPTGNTTLNLIAGGGVSITGSAANWTIANTGLHTLKVNGTNASSQTSLNFENGLGIAVTDLGSGNIQISSTYTNTQLNVKESPYNAQGAGSIDFTASIAAGSNVLSAIDAPFSSGDASKTICMLGAGTNGTDLWTTISSVPSDSFALTSVDGSGNYTGTITGGAGNAFVNYAFNITGFTNSNNNGVYICTASTGTTLSFGNATTVESATANALGTGYNALLATPAITTVVWGSGNNSYTLALGVAFWFPTGEDDTAAIQAALNDASSGGNFPGAGIFVPNGIYVISSPLTINNLLITPSNFVCQSNAYFVYQNPAVSAHSGFINFTTSVLCDITNIQVVGPQLGSVAAPDTSFSEIDISVLSSVVRELFVVSTSQQYDFHIENSFGDIDGLFGVAQSWFALDNTTLANTRCAAIYFAGGYEGGTVLNCVTAGDNPAVTAGYENQSADSALSLIGCTGVSSGSVENIVVPVCYLMRGPATQLQNCSAENFVWNYQLINSGSTGNLTSYGCNTILGVGSNAGTGADIVVGPVGPWAPSSPFVVDMYILDSNGNRQRCTTAGTSGASEPTWAMSGDTTDGTVTWTVDTGSIEVTSNVVVRDFSSASGSANPVWSAYDNAGYAINTVYDNCTFVSPTFTANPFTSAVLNNSSMPSQIFCDGVTGTYRIDYYFESSGTGSVTTTFAWTDGSGAKTSPVAWTVSSAPGYLGGSLVVYSANADISASTNTASTGMDATLRFRVTKLS
jgi:hypothetical protein